MQEKEIEKNEDVLRYHIRTRSRECFEAYDRLFLNISEKMMNIYRTLKENISLKNNILTPRNDIIYSFFVASFYCTLRFFNNRVCIL